MFRWDPVSPKLNWSKFMEAKRKELQRLTKAYEGTLGRANVDIIEGRGKIVDAHTVEVAGKQYTAKYILVAVGGTPSMIDLPGALCGSSTACHALPDTRCRGVPPWSHC